MHAGIQPCKSNAQISINTHLIPHYDEDSDRVRYYAINCYVNASDIDYVSTDIFLFQTKISIALSTTNSLTKNVRSQGPPWQCINQFESDQDNDEIARQIWRIW